MRDLLNILCGQLLGLTFAAGLLFAQGPSIAPGGVVGASWQKSIQPGAWASIFGFGLSAITRQWSSADFVNGALPTALDGVSVTVGGRAAFVEYISPTQINFETPPDIAPGSVAVTVTNQGSTSAPVTVPVTAISPALFRLGAQGGRYAAALVNSGNGRVQVAAADALYGRSPGFATAAQGQTVSVFGTGFGPTVNAVPAGVAFTGAYDLASSATATLGGVSAKVLFAGRVAPGLDQINILIPSIPDGDYPLVISVNGQVSQPDVFLSVGPGVNTSTPGIYNPIAKAHNSTVFLGDSISFSTQDYVNENWGSQTFIRSNAQVLKIGDAGVPGNTTAQMLARVEDVVALQPANCVLLGGTNDLGGDPFLTMANIDRMAKTLQQNGIRPILSLIPPRDGGFASVTAINAAIQEYAVSNGLPYLDFFSALADPATGNYLPQYSADGIHPSDVGAEVMAKKFLESARRFFMPVPSFLPTASHAERNILGANTLLHDLDGDGLADDWAITGGSGSLTFAPDADGVNWESITSDGSSFQIARQFIEPGPWSFSDGDRVAFVGRVKLSNPAQGGGSGTINVNIIQRGGVSTIWPLAGWTTNIDDDALYHEFTIPPDTLSVDIYVGVSGAGANIRIAQFGLYNLSR